MMVLRRTLVIASLLTAQLLAAQVRVDRPIVLQGPTPADRQVEDLSDPAAEGDALNARSLQASGHAYAVAAGVNDWTISLTPPPAALVAGMKLMVKATAGITGPVTLDVNGLGAHDVLKGAGLPLDAGDVASGEVASLLYDGAAFQLIGARRLERRDCPPGMAEVNELYCIEVNERDTARFDGASIACGNADARLCSWGEWYAACVQAAALGLNDMTGNWEWTNNAANADHNARVVGQANCPHAGASNGYDFANHYRCCFKR